MCGVKCSIITVSYNSSKTIEKTINSVLSQTYKDVEYIIVDGASSDGTVEIIKEYEPLFEGRMKWISEPDNGIYFAMNKGIQMSKGELIGIINSDDWYENDAVEKIVYGWLDAGKKPLSVLHGKTYAYGRDGNLRFISSLNIKNIENKMGSHPSCFVTKKAYETYGMFNTRYSCVADHDLMLRFYKSNNVDFIETNEHIANAILGGISSTNKAYLDMLMFQYDYKKITRMRFIIEKGKANFADVLIKHGIKPIKIRK